MFFVEVTRIEAGASPQLNATLPVNPWPPGRQKFKAASEQLGALPVPTMQLWVQSFASAGHCADEPEHCSLGSQASTDWRQTFADVETLSAGHDPLDPVQCSAMSQTPAL